jgi:hypothetical protein
LVDLAAIATSWPLVFWRSKQDARLLKVKESSGGKVEAWTAGWGRLLSHLELQRAARQVDLQVIHHLVALPLADLQGGNRASLAGS